MVSVLREGFFASLGMANNNSDFAIVLARSHRVFRFSLWQRLYLVIPAKAGMTKNRKTLPEARTIAKSQLLPVILSDERQDTGVWIPAFAGMTGEAVATLQSS